MIDIENLEKRATMKLITKFHEKANDLANELQKHWGRSADD